MKGDTTDLAKKKGCLRNLGVGAALFLGLMVIGALLPDSDTTEQRSTTTRRTTTTTTHPTTTTTLVPQTAEAAAEKCFSAWDGNHNGMERQIRERLNDPGSMETHATYFSDSDDLTDGTMLIRMDYGARNQLGGMVRTNAFGEMDIRTCEVTITDYGF